MKRSVAESLVLGGDLLKSGYRITDEISTNYLQALSIRHEAR